MSQTSSAPRDDETPAGRGPLIQGGPLGRVLGAIEIVLSLSIAVIALRWPRARA